VSGFQVVASFSILYDFEKARKHTSTSQRSKLAVDLYQITTIDEYENQLREAEEEQEDGDSEDEDEDEDEEQEVVDVEEQGVEEDGDDEDEDDEDEDDEDFVYEEGDEDEEDY
jgi:hypothetical protein